MTDTSRPRALSIAFAVGAVLALVAFGLVLTTNVATMAWSFPALAVPLRLLVISSHAR